ncbi:MAG: ATP-binding cassette domain-containing protein [Candidatus Binatia bacterium]|nr:ATP-binding cassette domain-containing protein [Candidatus Binatia bacterium]
MSSQSIARARDVSVALDGKRILEGVSLEIMAGELVAIVGPSGSGKTTLLRTFNYLTPLASGEIEVAGIRLRPGLCERADAKLLLQLRRTVGMVFQDLHLFPHLTVLQNLIEAPVRVRRLAPREARDRARAGLERLGISHLSELYPRQLSGGEQQRVALLRTLLMEPQLLLLDEPTSALDAANVDRFVQVLMEFQQRGGATLMVTHQPQLARQLAAHVAVLNGGRLVQFGPPTLLNSAVGAEPVR